MQVELWTTVGQSKYVQLLNERILALKWTTARFQKRAAFVLFVACFISCVRMLVHVVVFGAPWLVRGKLTERRADSL